MDGYQVCFRPVQKFERPLTMADFIDRKTPLADYQKDLRIRALELALVEIFVEAASLMACDPQAKRSTANKATRISKLANVMLGTTKNPLIPINFSFDLVKEAEYLFKPEKDDENINDSGGSKE